LGGVGGGGGGGLGGGGGVGGVGGFCWGGGGGRVKTNNRTKAKAEKKREGPKNDE